MTTDIAFKKADLLLDKASKIWKDEIKESYQLAERYYWQAVAIRDEYFSDNKNVLTDDLCPF